MSKKSILYSVWAISILFFLFSQTEKTFAKEPTVTLGIDYLEQSNFAVLDGKRVGLLTHPAGRNGNGESTVDVFVRSKKVNLVALFGPEHGIYGDEKASVPVDDKIDIKTGLPVFSLYGKFRKPTSKMLADIDSLVIDLQDVGVRCYTYISCMRYAMEACFEGGVEVVVLDRPNPLGGMKVAGPPMDEACMSYVGAFQVPFVHGMTIGEIALWSKKVAGVLKTKETYRKKGKLVIVPMLGWTRQMTWPQTGLSWYPTSPNIPTLDAVAGYPMTGLGAQMGKFKHGIGTKHPFRFLTYEGKSAEDIKAALEQLKIPGLAFKIKTLQLSDGKKKDGVYIVIDDWNAWRPTDLPFFMMQLSALWQIPSPFGAASESEIMLFNKHVGSQAWWDALLKDGGRVDAQKFLTSWNSDSERFKSLVKPYLLY
ncbi:MAG: DUF1343 domain-containing protein [Opitutae bacterium]|jgi:uncharacterized protein YbbC (DUF1343 family)|nr:DUF1343 domain-containing protein [Opitutae bacterium]MBT5715442.1 DUF1343 domain-containing protein [Opitutae bacterium]